MDNVFPDNACALQNRTGDCRDPTFEHYTSKPYVIGLQDTLFSCSDAIHDFYHVEPQHTCLLDAQSNLVIDWVVRCVPWLIRRLGERIMFLDNLVHTN